jgi:hypothetical protein
LKKVTFKNKYGYNDTIHGEVQEYKNYIVLTPAHSDNNTSITIERNRIVDIKD